MLTVLEDDISLFKDLFAPGSTLERFGLGCATRTLGSLASTRASKVNFATIY